MHVLRIEHGVGDFDEWKKMFDDDPLGREQSGVLRYRVLRAADDPNHVMIDLDFDSEDAADQLHKRLLELWGRVDVMRDPRARSAEVVESKEY